MSDQSLRDFAKAWAYLLGVLSKPLTESTENVIYLINSAASIYLLYAFDTRI